MSANLFATALSIFFSACFCLAQPTITIPEGTTPVMDGTVSPGEWSDADSATIDISASVSCKVLFKHDCTGFYFAYLDNLESMAVLFPEVLFDINNSKSSSWEADDWWFHVSATDCYYQGAYANYSNCVVSHPNWSGVPNFTSGPPPTDTVEIRIPFTTINMTIPDTIGICFDLTNTASAWYLWPSTATTTSPATWANAVISCSSIGINEDEAAGYFSVYPSPARDEIILELKDKRNILAIEIIDMTGRKVMSIPVEQNEKIKIDIRDLQTGLLLLKIITLDKKEFTEKIQVIR